MRIEYHGYFIAESTGHGKTVSGAKKTSSIQVRHYFNDPYGSYLLKKQISYPVGDSVKREKAIEKCKNYIDLVLNNTMP